MLFFVIQMLGKDNGDINTALMFISLFF